ncbi:V-type proton ATPase subunit G 2 isoform X2 [Loxodonta africana]|uniref:V-type proton ATPase subunit G 2 isoform X2 n=1 Tax=Loxodonta africana TaxID=9785 RepID=UPI0030CECF76
MASQSQGIQQLLQAEKRAAEKVADARKRKARRLKQAKEEAQMEVEQYRREREQEFQSKQQALEQVCPSLEPTRPQVTLTTGPRTPWELSVLAALHQHAHMEGCPERRPAWQEPKGSGETHRRLFFRSLAPAYWQPRRREAGVEGSQKPEVKADPFLRRCCRRHTRPPCSAL